MEIILDKVYRNKTKLYLLSTLKDYGKPFEERFTKLYKLAVGIGDFALMDMGKILEDSIYILVDTRYSRTDFKFLLTWLQTKSYYVDDYPFDDIHLGHLHMLVVKIPIRHEDTLKEFNKGAYSKMYKKQDVYKLFKGREKELGTFTKDPRRTIDFVEEVNDIFNTDVDPKTWEGELDFPIKEREEFFNVELFINRVKRIENG